MSNRNRIISACFSALPAVYFFIQAVFIMGRNEYYWKTDVAVTSVLVVSSLLLGFLLPPLLSWFRLRASWISILTAGILAMVLALLVMTLLNATPLCVGQDNGDGNNDLGMCMGYVVLAGMVFGAVYLFFLATSAFVGHWMIKNFNKQ